MSAPDHTHSHRHDCNHGHSHAPVAHNRAFAIGVALNVGFVIIEAAAGFLGHSLALLADAGHNLSDVLGLLLAWGAIWISGKRASTRRTYGFGRTTIMASLINAIILLITVGGIAWEALARFADPQPVAGDVVIWVAAIGMVVNAGTAAMFMSGSKGDLNIRGAFLHMAADAGVSLGVVVAALIMTRTGLLWIDPVIGLIVALVIAFSAWGLLRESLDLSLDAVPDSIDRDAIADFLAGLPGVTAVHDLHIWPLSTSSAALTAHLVKPDAIVDDAEMNRICDLLHHEHGIDHATLQLERGDSGIECRLADIHAPSPQ